MVADWSLLILFVHGEMIQIWEKNAGDKPSNPEKILI